MLFSTPLKRVVHSWNMLTITFCAHRNLLIAFAISPDLCIAGSAIYFGILCLHLTPGICLRFPNSGEIWASAKLMLHHIGVPGTLFWPHWRPPYHSIIHYFVVEHFHCQCPSKLKLRGCRLLPCSGSALDWIASATEQMNMNCRVGHHFVCQTCSSPMGTCRAAVSSLNRRMLMYSVSLKGAPSFIVTGFADLHILRSDTPSKHAIKKWQPR